jgi:hypothetical protein
MDTPLPAVDNSLIGLGIAVSLGLLVGSDLRSLRVLQSPNTWSTWLLAVNE